MTFKKRKKNTRQRGSMSHGWGSKKKHRGKGNKGGAGKAGTGKRGDAKKPSIWKLRYFGKRGFKKKTARKKIKPINIMQLEYMLHKFRKEGEHYIIDINSMGYNKLLGSGNARHKMKINVDFATKKAVEKIKKVGGEVKLKKEE
ncbi:50S ribosomal protein L15 [Candidatus Woesearchaeota archaeon]|nr:50S ribosomal protein L15 [Candidatus Woesearchaeota archaeon]